MTFTKNSKMKVCLSWVQKIDDIFYVKINDKKSAEPLSTERKKETTKLSM